MTKALLEQRLVACVHSYALTSCYIWNGDIVTSDEIMLQMKTKTVLFSRVKTLIESLHPYEVPEIIMTPVVDANRAYLEWIEKSLETS